MPKSKKTSPSSPSPKTKNYSVTIRMYYPGFGDCFLLTFQATDGTARYMLIDCGVYTGYPEGSNRLKKIVQDIAAVTHNHLHIVAVTHEHADHISGFIDTNFKDIQIDDLWLAWTEDPTDTIARQLKAGIKKQVEELTSAVNRIAKNNALAADALQSVLNFEVHGGLGVKGSELQYLKDKSNRKLMSSSDYRHPGEPPLTIPGVNGVRVYVLGPPRSVADIHNLKDEKEMYPKFTTFRAALKGNPADVSPEDALIVRRSCPFDKRYDLTSEEAKTEKFFETNYGFSADAGQGPAWRRIDDDWLDSASELALKIGDYVNNTSLVLAFELTGSEPNKVLLFVGDAQVGNWLSWPDVQWNIEANGKKETIKGGDLLHHTAFYKTGHHGSINATLKQKGLEMMDGSRLVSMIPVDQHWVETTKASQGWVFPSPKLLAGLEEKSQNRVLRTDKIASMPGVLEEQDTMDKNVRQDFLDHVKWDTDQDHLWIQYTVEG